MKPIFDYLDYREYLKDAYEERKAETPAYSYRIMADSFGLYPSNIFRILHGQSHLPARCQSRAVEELGLSGRGADYFLLLIAYARERSSTARKDLLCKAMALRDVSRRDLEERELGYFRHWWVASVRALLEITRGRAVGHELASCLVPPVEEAKILEALELLKELGLVKRASSGRLLPAEAHLTAGGEAKAVAVRNFQKQILSLASEALERVPMGERDVSTLTLSIDESAFREIRDLLRECRRSIQKRVEQSVTPDRVMQLAMAFFPSAYAPKEPVR
jgi:uncharacterized protein (TIGR02147 family)